ncbi:MAG TPA: branched-chain amino acid ABC transporter permease, partial [Ramlibacter sp.]|nr:branched-chain amino acid ABC transporter permease [Ramlibacter sp.]
MLDTLVSQAANGLVLGFIYVLIAVGLSITFGLLGVINFAHGAFFALGAYAAYQLYQSWGWVAVILAPPLVGVVGMVVEVTIIRRLYGKEPLLSLIVTFALALLMEALIRWFWGADGKPFSPPAFLAGIVEYGPLLITKYRVAVLGATIA